MARFEKGNTLGKKFVTGESQREIARKGAAASNKKQAEKRNLIEALKILLETGDTQDRVNLALLDQALKGNVKAYEVIRDSVGLKPVDKIDQTNNGSIVVEIQKFDGDKENENTATE